MKNLITFLMCTFFLSGILAQNVDGPGRKIPVATPEIQALYAQQKDLKATGSTAELAKNREAIIAAWKEIDPEIAAEFKPTQIKETEPLTSEVLLTKPIVTNNKNPLWTNDLLIDSGKFDGVDIDTAEDGSIYVVGYENKKRYGLGNDVISIYKSTDNGDSFLFLTGSSGPKDYTKIKLNLMDRGVNKYLFYTTTSTDGSLINYRINIDGGPFNFTFEFIAQDAIEFDIDVDYEFQTQSQLYVLYTKSDNSLYSARSATDGSGLNWGDEHSFGYFASECAISYGKGNTYASFVGNISGDLYFSANSGYNEPTGWETPRKFVPGDTWESKDLSLAAERIEGNEYRVVLVASRKILGTNMKYYGLLATVNTNTLDVEYLQLPDWNLRYWDSWCRKEDGNTSVRTSFENTTLANFSILNYDNQIWDDPEMVSNNPITPQKGSSAVAEDINHNAIAVYIGENRTGLYFDSDKPLGLEETTFNGFVFYPNPTTNTVTLKAESPISNVAIFNLLGQQVLNQKADALASEINVSSLSSGTYVMKVTIGSEIGTYKIIKN